MKLSALRPARIANVEAIDETIRLLSETLRWARLADERPALAAVFSALRVAKGARQHLARRMRSAR